MTNSNNPESIILSAMRMVESNENSNIRLNANGGNSILIVCEPFREIDYIKGINQLMPSEKYEIIDLNHVLYEFVAVNQTSLEESFSLLKGSLHQIFKTPDGEDGPDLFGLILKAIEESLQEGKIPVLIHAGALYGTGIDNIHIMENDLIMQSALPLIILYPATREGDKLMFLSSRPASKYRCLILE